MLFEIVSTLSAGLFAGPAIYLNLVEHPARVKCGTESSPAIPPKPAFDPCCGASLTSTDHPYRELVALNVDLAFFIRRKVESRVSKRR
jgi:hypothetical protein